MLHAPWICAKPGAGRARGALDIREAGRRGGPLNGRGPPGRRRGRAGCPTAVSLLCRPPTPHARARAPTARQGPERGALPSPGPGPTTALR